MLMALEENEKTKNEKKQQQAECLHAENMTTNGADAPFFHFAVALAPAPARVLFVGALHSLRTVSKGRKCKYLLEVMLALSLLMGGGSISFCSLA
jgi:hypothetical protein